MTIVIEGPAEAPHVISLVDFQPPERVDGKPWTAARIEGTPTPESGWAEVETVELDPVDEDPSDPALRSFTLSSAEDWLRIVFLDEDGAESSPSAIAATSGPQFRPTLSQVSAVLRARTYTGSGDDDPMSVLAGGELAGEFNTETRPTAEQVEDDLIPQACVDLARAVGKVPGVLLDDARRVAALGAAKEIERSYIPEQTDPDTSIYQTLRLTYEEKSEDLRRHLQWWALTQHGSN